MHIITKKSPVVKDNALPFQITLIIFSVITAAFLISPTILFIKSNNVPLTEMPTDSFYYVLRLFFGVSIIIASVVFTVLKNASIISLPSFVGLVTAIYPLVYKINVYKDYKAFVEKFNMTANFSGHYINIGIYILLIILCIFTLLYSIGLLPSNLILLVTCALTATAVVFIIIDRSKSIEFGIFNIYDILCFGYASVAALLPVLVVTSTQKAEDVQTDNEDNNYRPKRMKL